MMVGKDTIVRLARAKHTTHVHLPLFPSGRQAGVEWGHSSAAADFAAVGKALKPLASHNMLLLVPCGSHCQRLRQHQPTHLLAGVAKLLICC